MPFGQRTQPLQGLAVTGLLNRDFGDGVIFHDPVARHVAALGFQFAPLGHLHQHGNLAFLARPELDALPGIGRAGRIGRRRRQNVHFLLKPWLAA